MSSTSLMCWHIRSTAIWIKRSSFYFCTVIFKPLNWFNSFNQRCLFSTIIIIIQLSFNLSLLSLSSSLPWENLFCFVTETTRAWKKCLRLSIMFGQQQRILIRKETRLGNTGGRSIKMWKLNYKHWLSYTQLKTLLGIKSIKVLKNCFGSHTHWLLYQTCTIWTPIQDHKDISRS